MKINFRQRLGRLLVILACFSSLDLHSAYILRYNTTDNGSISYTGNTLGLSKALGQNNPGTSDAIGAFITTQNPLPAPVGSYPNDGTVAGTTLNYLNNSSSAVLDLPPNSQVLYAELIWSGSFSFYSEITGNQPDGPVTLVTPQLQTFNILADPATKQNATTPSYGCPGPTPTPCQCPCGNYVRSANVTNIIQAAGAGTYTVGKVAGTVNKGDDTHNAANWTLAVVYQNPSMFTYNMSIFVGCEQASSNTNQPASVTGFCAPPSGTLKGRLFISATEADANKTGDTMLFGSSLPLGNSNRLSGGNNPLTNFFASQVNSLLPLSTDPSTGKLVAIGSSQLDTRGSYGTKNANANTATNISGGRQGYDVTSIDVSNLLAYNQTTAYVLGTTTGDDYTITSLGLQIQVGAPILNATKLVNGLTSVHSLVGDTVTFTFALKNTGTADAFSVVFTDLLELGLNFVSGSFKFNGATQPNPNLVTGFSVGTLAVNQTATIEFKALITSYPQVENVFYNSGSLAYTFQPCKGNLIPLSAATNVVSIILPCECKCCPGAAFITCPKK